MLLAELTSPQVRELDRNLPVVVPIAAHEQHGAHLPLYTDSYLLGEVVRRLQDARPQDVVIAPLQWLGNSHHHRDFPGTLSAAPRMYLDLVQGLVNNLIDDGFRRILVLNGHGGNDIPGQQSMFEIRQQHRGRSDLLLLFSSYWRLRPSEVDPELRFQQVEMGHACEWETSMMLRLAPALVGNYLSAKSVDPSGSFLPAYRAWVTQDRSAVGHIGFPALASIEKGEYLFKLFAGGVIGLIDRIRCWNGQTWKEETC
ncbi:MAG: creatininase family protein [Planctomycetaceae bacterium]|nr:creatininase family protein [Planctomycetaceae bacterium]